MAWFVQPRQLKANRRWRMVAESDEGGGIAADESHDHETAEEASQCVRCDEYMASVTGFPSRKRRAEMDEERDRSEYDRLRKKFERTRLWD